MRGSVYSGNLVGEISFVWDALLSLREHLTPSKGSPTLYPSKRSSSKLWYMVRDGYISLLSLTSHIQPVVGSYSFCLQNTHRIQPLSPSPTAGQPGPGPHHVSLDWCRCSPQAILCIPRLPSSQGCPFPDGLYFHSLWAFSLH